MTSTKLYGIIFVILAGISTVQFGLESLLVDESYNVALVVILGLSSIKAMGVAGWYMHLRDDPRALTYVALAGVLGVLAVTAGAAYSVT